MLKVKIINRSGNALPTYATPQSAGMDLRANLEAPVELLPMQRRLIPTGLYIELPPGYEAQVRPRSGLALKHGITVLNTPGTIDADYRGELSVLLINFSNQPFIIQPGERIAQMVVARHEQVEWCPEEQLSETERGAGGYGHSGLLSIAGALLLMALTATDASAAGRVSRRQQKAERAAAVADSLAFEQAREEARRDYFYFAALQNRAAGGKAKSSVEMLRHAADIDSTSAPVAFSLAEYYERSGDKNNALAMSSKAAAIDTNNLWYGLKEAELLMELNRPAEAITSYERLLRSHPDDVDICAQLGELYANQDSLRDCLRMLNRVEEIEGISPTLTMQKFYVYMHMGEPDSAFAVTQRLVDRHPYNATYRIIQGDILLSAGRTDDALSSYEAAGQLEPNNANLWISKANYYTVTGDEVRADSMIRAALTHPELELEQKIKLLTEYLRNTLRNRQDSVDDVEMTDKEASIDNLFATVSAMHPTAAEPYVLHAQYLSAIDHDSLAVRCIRDAVDLQPAKEEYWGLYLNLAVQMDDSALVRRVAHEALQYHPSLVVGYLYLAQVELMGRNFAGAQEVYRTAITHMSPADKGGISTFYGYIGDLYQNRGMMDSTYISYDEALKYNAENVSVLNNYSYFLALQNRDLDRAERMISTVVRLKADEPTYLDTYAWVYFKQGNYMLAKFYQKRAIDASGKNVTATLLEHYGDILSCSGDSTGALEYWQRALALPDNTSKTLEQKISTGTYIEEPFEPGE